MLIGQQIASLPYSLFATHYWLPGFSLFVAGLPSAILRKHYRPIELNRAF